MRRFWAAAAVLADGYVLLRGCLSEAAVATLQQRLDAAGAADEYVVDSLFNQGAEFLEYLDLPSVLGVVESALQGGNGGRGGDAPPSDCHMVQVRRFCFA